MENNNANIEQIKAYLDGKLKATDALYVEQQIAESEEWRTIYEGLLFADYDGISTKKVTEDLFERINKPQAKVIKMQFLQKWGTVAAAFAGLIAVAFGTIYIMNTQFTQNETVAVVNQSNDWFREGDQIEIISSTRSNKRVQNFDADQIQSIELDEEIPDPIYEEEQIIRPQDVEIEQTALNDESQFEDYVSRRGFKEIRLKDIRSTSGLNSPDQYKNTDIVATNAVPNGDLKAFTKTMTEEYTMRFPFNGIVIAKFIVDENGHAIDFTFTTSPNKETEEVVRELFSNKATWKPATNQTGKNIAQHVLAKVSFGNTNYIQVEFE